MGGARNKQMLRVAVIVGVALVILYLFFSWQSDVKAHKDKLTAASAEYQDLLIKYNKLNEELRSNVRTAAETRHELESVRKTQKLEATKREEQIRKFMEELREIKSKAQRMESERDRLKTENEQLEVDKQSVSDKLDHTINLLDELKLSSARDAEDLKQCRADLEGVRAKLLSAQTETVGAGEKLQECQLQLSTATDAYESCQQRINVLETDNHNKMAEIQQLQTQANLYKQQQQESQKQSIPQQKDTGFKDHVISDEHKQKTLALLKQKRRNGETLGDQEQHILQMVPGNKPQAPQIKQKISVPLEAKPDVPAVDNQQAPPPDHRQLQHADEEQVEDLVDEDKKKGEGGNLDNQEDADFEGGADGGDQQDGRDFQHEQEQEYGERNKYGNKEGEEDKEDGNPLPNPVHVDPGNDEKDYGDDPNGDVAFQRDHEKYHNEMRQRLSKDLEQGMRHHEWFFEYQ